MEANCSRAKNALSRDQAYSSQSLSNPPPQKKTLTGAIFPLGRRQRPLLLLLPWAGAAIRQRRGLAGASTAASGGDGGGGEDAGAFHENFSRVYGPRWRALYAALRRPTRHVARVNGFFLGGVVGGDKRVQEEAVGRLMQRCALMAAESSAGLLRVPSDPLAGSSLSSSLPLCFVGRAEEAPGFAPPTEARARWLAAVGGEQEGGPSSPAPQQPVHVHVPLPYYIMDLASVLAALALDAREGQAVADFCAAPGERGQKEEREEVGGLLGVVECALTYTYTYMQTYNHIITNTTRRQVPHPRRAAGGQHGHARGQRPLQGPQRAPGPDAARLCAAVPFGGRAGGVPGREQVVPPRATSGGKCVCMFGRYLCKAGWMVRAFGAAACSPSACRRSCV